MWFLKLLAKFLESTDDGVHVHIGTSSGGGGEHEIHVNVKGDGRERPWRDFGDRNSGVGGGGGGFRGVSFNKWGKENDRREE